MSLVISPAELPQWVPGVVLSASDTLGWTDVALRSYRYHGLDVQVPALDHYTIVRYRVGTTPMERRFDGRWTRTRCAPGDLSLLTRSQDSHWHWTDDIDVSHVYLSNALVSRVANDVLERSVAEVRLHDLLRAQDPTLMRICDAIADEARDGGVGGALYVEALGTQLAVHLLRHYACVTFRETAAGGRLTGLQERRVLDYIEARLHETVTLEDLAKTAGLGVWTFSRHFRATTGRAPHAYLIDRRVERAKRLLLQGDRALKEVASACGFADQAHLTRVLHARLGTTPAQLRRSSVPHG
ncbi:MAG: helix-turn-helix transcriptional regulator [Proteobacteria bacterium]|nr:helix-turn-helix transcriptional regulator [Pseudomonadota bacterium]